MVGPPGSGDPRKDTAHGVAATRSSVRSVDRSPNRVAIITSFFWPEVTGISQTVTEFAEFLASHGFAVRVATAMPFYPQWKIWDSYRGRLFKGETKGDIRIYRNWHLVSPRPSTLARLLHSST